MGEALGGRGKRRRNIAQKHGGARDGLTTSKSGDTELCLCDRFERAPIPVLVTIYAKSYLSRGP